MKKLTPAFLTSMGLALMAAALVGCHDDDCDVDIGADPVPAQEFRDPQTGQCVFIGGNPRPNPGTCGDFDPVPLEEAPVPQPDFAECYVNCEGNDEITCVETPACRAIYQGDTYLDCWGTAPSGPIAGLVCAELDAYACSQTDHCAAVHAPGGQFVSCEDEKRACASSSDCGGSATCSTENGECLGGPGCQFGPCDDGCWGFCEEPNNDPGNCTDEVACDLPEPACPAGTIAGRTTDCWTGWCIPVEACGSTTCADLTESECAAAATCTGLYRGEDCSCDPIDGCSCTSYRYEGCGDS